MRLDLIYFSQTIVVFTIINIIHKRYSYIFFIQDPLFVHFFLLNIYVPPVRPVFKHVTVRVCVCG